MLPCMTGLRLIPSQKGIFSSLLPWASDISFHIQRAVLVFMSREMKAKHCQDKHSTFPRKLIHKPLLHTMICKVQSTHQAQTEPWSHTPLGQKPSGIAASKGNLRVRMTPIQETGIHSPTFTAGSRLQATGPCFSVSSCREAPPNTVWQHMKSMNILSPSLIFSNKHQLVALIASCFYTPSLPTVLLLTSDQLRIFLSAVSPKRIRLH